MKTVLAIRSGSLPTISIKNPVTNKNARERDILDEEERKREKKKDKETGIKNFRKILGSIILTQVIYNSRYVEHIPDSNAAHSCTNPIAIVAP